MPAQADGSASHTARAARFTQRRSVDLLPILAALLARLQEAFATALLTAFAWLLAAATTRARRGAPQDQRTGLHGAGIVMTAAQIPLDVQLHLLHGGCVDEVNV